MAAGDEFDANPCGWSIARVSKFFMRHSCCCRHSAPYEGGEAEEEIRVMKSWVLAAGLLAAARAGQAMAADLDEGPPPDRYGVGL